MNSILASIANLFPSKRNSFSRLIANSCCVLSRGDKTPIELFRAGIRRGIVSLSDDTVARYDATWLAHRR